jgi:hypothetical protein
MPFRKRAMVEAHRVWEPTTSILQKACSTQLCVTPFFNIIIIAHGWPQHGNMASTSFYPAQYDAESFTESVGGVAIKRSSHEICPIRNEKRGQWRGSRPAHLRARPRGCAYSNCCPRMSMAK